jgi:hypothetical protein
MSDVLLSLSKSKLHYFSREERFIFMLRSDVASRLCVPWLQRATLHIVLRPWSKMPRNVLIRSSFMRVLS